jgi:hypothetical protein
MIRSLLALPPSSSDHPAQSSTVAYTSLKHSAIACCWCQSISVSTSGCKQYNNLHCKATGCSDRCGAHHPTQCLCTCVQKGQLHTAQEQSHTNRNTGAGKPARLLSAHCTTDCTTYDTRQVCQPQLPIVLEPINPPPSKHHSSWKKPLWSS